MEKRKKPSQDGEVYHGHFHRTHKGPDSVDRPVPAHNKRQLLGLITWRLHSNEPRLNRRDANTLGGVVILPTAADHWAELVKSMSLRPWQGYQ